MQKWHPRTVVNGGTRWVEQAPGKWVDLGKLTGPQLVAWCYVNKCPLPGYGKSFVRGARHSQLELRLVASELSA